jgi:putative membrane protein
MQIYGSHHAYQPEIGTWISSVRAIIALGAVYEIIEWGMMVVRAPQAGTEFVGAQGDPWDAQNSR